MSTVVGLHTCPDCNCVVQDDDPRYRCGKPRWSATAPTIERPRTPLQTQPERDRETVTPQRKTDISRTPPPDEMREITRK